MGQNTGLLDSSVVKVRSSLEAGPLHIEIAPHSSSHPDLVLLVPSHGLIAIDFHSTIQGDGRAQFVELNRRIDALRTDLHTDTDLPIARVLAVHSGVSEPTTGIANRVIVPTAQLEDMRWLGLIDQETLHQDALQELRATLFPSITFTSQLRRGVSDDSADDRAALRVVLDQQQADVAGRVINNALALTGPPGSGKTLVLVARARRLAAEHPDWRIQLLCYNKTLIPYLRRLVSDAPNVKVNRIWEIASEFGIRFSYADDEVTSAGLKAAEHKGLGKTLDAVLIDEAQDFRLPWLQIAHALARPDRGGLMLAGDTAQALYHDGDLEKFLCKIRADRVQLEVPYRSTRQILSATQSLDPSFDVVGLDHAPEGPPVDLVWAQSWDEQAKCVAFEVNHMLTAGGLEPRDIGILVTKYAGTYGRIQRELDQYEIPYSAMSARDKSEFDLFSNTVKLLTVHSAKGYEFKAVVLFGLETLPDPNQPDPDIARRARVAFVGTTRAMNSLLITYTRDNKFLTMLSSDEEHVSRYCWPDDYEEVSVG